MLTKDEYLKTVRRPYPPLFCTLVCMGYRSKDIFVVRGMPIYMVKKICPEAVIVSSGYDIYGLFSRRVFAIIQRFTSKVEKYSIDECFVDVTEECEGDIDKALKLAKEMKEVILKELGITFSFGVSTTKVLAKVASKLQKPNGLVVIDKNNRREVLATTQIEKVWGIGRETSVLCRKHGLTTALAFADLTYDEVGRIMAKPYQEIWQELIGVSTSNTHEDRDAPKSIMRTGTFSPKSSDQVFLLSELAGHVEDACAALRRHNLSTKSFSFFLKSQDFRYYREECSLFDRVSTPQEIMKAINAKWNDAYRPGILYRSTGVAFFGLQKADTFTFDIFGEHKKRDDWNEVYKVLDKLEAKHQKRNPPPHIVYSLPYMGEVV